MWKLRNINSVEVCLRQWLYNHGDECLWNTGGWMKCAISGANNGGNGNMPSFSTNVNLLADKIELICTGSATSKMDWSGSTKWFYRNGFTIKANIGTQKELVKDISLYKKLKTTTSNGLSGTFRTGGANNAGTAVNTATILASGSAEEMDINIASSYPFLVIGAYYQTSSVTVGWSDPGTASVNYNSDITEIWLE